MQPESIEHEPPVPLGSPDRPIRRRVPIGSPAATAAAAIPPPPVELQPLTPSPRDKPPPRVAFLPPALQSEEATELLIEKQIRGGSRLSPAAAGGQHGEPELKSEATPRKAERSQSAAPGDGRAGVTVAAAPTYDAGGGGIGPAQDRASSQPKTERLRSVTSAGGVPTGGVLAGKVAEKRSAIDQVGLKVKGAVGLAGGMVDLGLPPCTCDATMHLPVLWRTVKALPGYFCDPEAVGLGMTFPGSLLCRLWVGNLPPEFNSPDKVKTLLQVGTNARNPAAGCA